MRLLHVVGTRPNLVKMAPVIAALKARFPEGPNTVVHTGQHYDREMSAIFFEELGIGDPDYTLGVGSGTHAEQTARVIERIERVLLAERPDVVLVPGDVNSTLAAALAAAKLDMSVAHVESGLRSFDRSMPEELNRVLVDHTAELLFLHCDDAVENLRREGIDDERMRFVGNTMIDTLVALEGRFRAREAAAGLGLEPGSFLLVTLHRPALVDGPLLGDAMAALSAVASELPVVFPIHPRTRKMLGDAEPEGVRLLDPIGYLDFLSLEADAAAVLTDSGGIQEETTYLGIPCFTLRDNTERPVTVEHGTNRLLGLDPARIEEIPALLAERPAERPQPPPKWDGHAAERIAEALADW
jgi:UDP-N-acetylglucosamine 2-epimerase (non-hydrolysing)